jgi:hypothetical protein
MIVVTHRFRVRQVLLGSAPTRSTRDRVDEAGERTGDARRGGPDAVAAGVAGARAYSVLSPALTARVAGARAGH